MIRLLEIRAWVIKFESEVKRLENLDGSADASMRHSTFENSYGIFSDAQVSIQPVVYQLLPYLRLARSLQTGSRM